MRNRLLDLPGLLRTPVGRRQIVGGVLHRAWPLTSRLAILHRQTISRGVCIITVVGSYGKSTATRCVAAALGDAVRPPKSGNHKASTVWKILGLRRNDKYSVMEVGIDAPGQMAPLAGTIRPDIAVVTCIGSEHNRSLGDLETTRHEKAEMVRMLPPSGLAVLNGDDENVRWMAGQTRAGVLTYGIGEHNDVRATEVELDWPRGMGFQLHARGETCSMKTRLIGRHMVYPILAAVTVAVARGFGLEDSIRRLESIEPAPGRMHISRLENGAVLLCDYFKSSYETIHAALDTFADVPAKRRIVVMGEVSEPPGSQGPIYRAIGERIAQIADRAVFVGHNFQRYKAGTTRGGMDAGAVVSVGHEVLDAAKVIGDDLGPGDVVLIKGRDRQRLDRVALMLEGHEVGCKIPDCRLKGCRCRACPMLVSGWQGIDVVT